MNNRQGKYVVCDVCLYPWDQHGLGGNCLASPRSPGDLGEMEARVYVADSEGGEWVEARRPTARIGDALLASLQGRIARA